MAGGDGGWGFRPFVGGFHARASRPCVRAVRFRFRPLDRLSVCALAQAVNFALILAYLALFPNGCADFPDYVLRVFADSLLSAVVLIFAARFAILVPLSLLKFAGVEPKIEEDS